MQVFVAGADGCVGRALSRELSQRGHDVTAASRSPDPEVLPEDAETMEFDVTAPLEPATLEGADAVVNLVALPSHQSQPRGAHQRVHVEGTRNLVDAAEDADADVFLQLSALGVESDVDTAYMQGKRDAEDVVRESRLSTVIFRPSVVFGDGCQFLPFLRRLSTFRVVSLPKRGETRVQPLYSGDLAEMLAAELEDTRHHDDVYSVGGPETYTLSEMLHLVRGRVVVLPLPDPVAYAAFAFAGWLPFVPFDLNQYRSFGLDNTVDGDDLRRLGFEEEGLRRLENHLDAGGGR